MRKDAVQLIQIVVPGIQADGLAHRSITPQAFAKPVCVALNQAIGGIENGLGRAVVLLSRMV